MTKKRILPPDRIAECKAAHDLFLEKKRELNLSQKKIADAAGITPAAVNLYFKGINPLNAQFAAVLSSVLEAPIEAFSPRLAEEIRHLSSLPRRAVVPESDSAVSSADLVKMMLAKHGKSLSEDARQRIAEAVEETASEMKAGQAYLPSNYANLRPTNDEIVIPQYDIRAAMGHGQVPPDYTEVVRNLVVREEILREKGVTYTSKTALAMINGWGQSMEGTINDKDLVIVDKGVQDFIGDGIYVLTWHQELYIKRVMRLDEENYRLISDNQHYENQTARIEDVTIHAKVLLIWNARKA